MTNAGGGGSRLRPSPRDDGVADPDWLFCPLSSQSVQQPSPTRVVCVEADGRRDLRGKDGTG